MPDPIRIGRPPSGQQPPVNGRGVFADDLSCVHIGDLGRSWLTVGRCNADNGRWFYDLTRDGYQTLLRMVASGRAMTTQRRNERTGAMHLLARLTGDPQR